MSYIGAPRDSLFEYVSKLADALAGEEETAYTGNEDILHHSLNRLSKHFEGNPLPTKMDKMDASTADSVAGVVSDLNDLILALKDAGLMKCDEFTLTFATVTDSISGRADRQYNTDKVSSVACEDNVITITLSAKVSALKDFNAGGSWGTHKWLGIGIGAGINPITGLNYNGSALTAEDVTEATQVGLSAGYFVRWVAADLVKAGDNSQASKDNFTLSKSGYETTKYTLKIVEPS